MSSRIGSLMGIALLSAGTAFAKPIEIHETQRVDIVINSSADFDVADVDIDPTGIIVGGRHGTDYGAFMFERNAAGTWVFKQQLGVTQTAVWPRVAIGGKEAVYDIGELRLVHRGGRCSVQRWFALREQVDPALADQAEAVRQVRRTAKEVEAMLKTFALDEPPAPTSAGAPGAEAKGGRPRANATGTRP